MMVLPLARKAHIIYSVIDSCSADAAKPTVWQLLLLQLLKFVATISQQYHPIKRHGGTSNYFTLDDIGRGTVTLTIPTILISFAMTTPQHTTNRQLIIRNVVHIRLKILQCCVLGLGATFNAAEEDTEYLGPTVKVLLLLMLPFEFKRRQSWLP